jgi:hypothetical protein
MKNKIIIDFLNKTFLMVFVSIVFITKSFSQSTPIDWVKQYAPGITSYSVCLDDSGNIYIAGLLKGQFNNGSTSFYAPFGSPIILKYGADTSFKWAVRGNGEGVVNKIIFGPDKQLYATGNITSTNNFGSITVSYLGGIFSYSSSPFALKLNTNGVFRWATNFNENGSDAEGISIAVTNANNLYVLTNRIGNSYRPRIYSLDTSGSLKSNSLLGTPSTYSQGINMEADQVGNYYVTYKFRGNSTLINNVNVKGNTDCILIKYNYLGEIQWYHHFYGKANGSMSFIDLKTDIAGNTYCIGNYEDTLYINNSATLIGKSNCFVLKFDYKGNLKIAKKINSKVDVLYKNGAIECDNSGNIYIATQIWDNDTIVFSNQTYYNPKINNVSNNRILLLKLNSNNTEAWARSIDYNNAGLKLTKDNAGNIYFNSFFITDTLKFITDNINILKTGTSTQRNSFIAKIGNNICGSSSLLSINTSSKIALCPNDSIVLTTSETKNTVWSNGDTTKSTIIKNQGYYNLFHIQPNSCLEAGNPLRFNKYNNPTVNFDTFGYCGNGKLVLRFTKFEPISDILWKLPDGSTYNRDTLKKEFGNTGQYNIKLILTNANGCIDSMAKSVNFVKYNNLITSVDSICANTNFSAQVSGLKNNTYVWGPLPIKDTIFSGATGSNGVNTCTNINFAGIGLRQFGAVIYNNYCKDTIIAKDVYLRENIKAKIATDASGFVVQICASTEFNVYDTTSNSNNYNYTWNVTYGSVIKGVNTSSPTIKYSNATNVNQLSVITGTKVNKINGCSTSLPNSRNFLIKPNSASISDFTGNLTFCAGNQQIFQQMNTDADSTFWYKDNQLVMKYDKTANYLIWNSLKQDSGVYQLKVVHKYNNDNSGNLYCFPSTNKTITINPRPVSSFTTSSVCPNTPLVFQNVSSASGLLYNWKFSDGTSSNLKQPNKTFSTGGNKGITLIVKNSFACADTLIQSLAIYNPSVASIIQKSDSLICPFTTNTTYQWYRNNVLLNGKNTNGILANQSGSYTVKTTNDKQCENTSSPFDFVKTGIYQSKKLFNLTIFPNPVSDLLNISFSEEIQYSKISILDICGKTIKEYEANNSKDFTIKIAELSNGIYFVNISTNDESKCFKILKK